MRHPRIEINPAVMVGKPVIKGTRITVELIARKLAAGVSIDDILTDHPRLLKDDILAAQIYALDGNSLGPVRPAHPDLLDDVSGWIGVQCSGVERLAHSWGFGFGDSGGMNVECPWRIISNGHIDVSSADDGQTFGLPEPFDAQARASDLLVGRRVRELSIEPASSDMRVEFENFVALELLNISSGYEAWNAVFSSKSGVVRLIALGGGELARREETRA
jgi:uncharacterized protein (DUF433 family)